MHCYSVNFIWDIQKKVSEQELSFYSEDMLDLVHMCAEGLHAIFLYYSQFRFLQGSCL